MVVVQWLKKPEYAALAGVSEKTVDAWRQNGKLVEGVDWRRLPGGKLLRFRSPDWTDEEELRRVAEITRAKSIWPKAIPSPDELDKRLRAMYGITVGDFADMMATQDGLCAICQENRTLLVDHCHRTGKVRGLLCHRCNVGIGFMDDSVPKMIRAIKYVQGAIDYPESPVEAETPDA